MKLIVLNDLHPDSNPGAASIAYSLAEQAGKQYETEYWCTEVDGVNVSGSQDVVVKIRRISQKRISKMEGGLLHRLYFEILGIREFFWIIRRIVESRPSHIWIHQIGTRFPKSAILFFKVFRISTVVTLHDFGIVLNRKLYPSDFGWLPEEVDQMVAKIENMRLEVSTPFTIANILLRVRRLLVVFCINQANSVVCISELQSTVLKSIGLKVSNVIHNGTSKCDCAAVIQSKGFNVLFAGRPNAKGLELLATSLASQPESHLHLAGSLRLVEIVSEYLNPEQFTYHGFLNPEQICILIHKVQLVSVISQCFDVYPTITLEAMSHRIPVITTALTGNFQYVKEMSESLIVPWGHTPDFTIIMREIESSKFDFPEICTASDSWVFYKDVINQIS